MSDFDCRSFWEENAECLKRLDGNAPRVPLIFLFEEYFLFGILPRVDSIRYYSDLVYRLHTHHEANDVLDREIGRRPYAEHRMAYKKGAFEVRLGAKRELHARGAAWIQPAVRTRDELKNWIEKTAATDLSRDAVPDEWREEKRAFESATGARLSFNAGLTGPVTVASNLLGATELCLGIMDDEQLFTEFFELLCTKQIEFHEALLREEQGVVPRNGMGVNDDSCCLFSPANYERFCYPYMERLLEAFAPEPEHKRRQHSDSAMAHLMPLLNGLGINEVNFGPEIHPAAVRAAMPEAVVHGQMPPMVLRNGDESEIERIVDRDFAALGKRNHCACPAGVVAAGTPFRNLRAYMRAISERTGCGPGQAHGWRKADSGCLHYPPSGMSFSANVSSL